MRDIYEIHDQFLEDLQSNIPQEWEASEGSAESICVEYVRAIEQRLIALGGSLERWPEEVETPEASAAIVQAYLRDKGSRGLDDD